MALTQKGLSREAAAIEGMIRSDTIMAQAFREAGMGTVQVERVQYGTGTVCVRACVRVCVRRAGVTEIFKAANEQV